MRDPLGMLVVGDVLVDVIAQPERPLELDPEVLDHSHGRVSFRLGGSGAHLALAATGLGLCPVRLVVGSDRSAGPGGGLLDELRAAGVDMIANSSALGVGTAVMVYLNGRDRVMIADPGASAEPLTDQTIERVVAALAGVGVVVVSGHALFRAATRVGVAHVMRAADAAGVPVALDLVPHAAYRTVSRTELDELLKPVTFLAAAADTLLAFAPSARAAPRDYAELPAAVEHFRRGVEGLLVHLPNNLFWTVDRAGGSVVDRVESPVRTGLTDRVMVEVLARRYCGWQGSVTHSRDVAVPEIA